MFPGVKKAKFPTQTQIDIWKLNRKRLSGKTIAKRQNVTPAFVSQALKETNERITALLEETAKANKVKVDYLDAELGFARGFSQMLKVKTFITFSPIKGIHVWYEHQGDCTSCEVLDECQSALFQEFKDRNILIDNSSLAPTHLAKKLFLQLEALIDDQE